jgi:hypothetical protein
LYQKDTTGFELLKKKIVDVMQQSYPGISPDISLWKGQDIVNFQEELLLKVNAHISEKWFYTHMKGNQHSLPRIDVLNLLSKYAGYADWNDFVFKNIGKHPGPIIKGGNRYFIIVPLLVIGTMGILFLLFKLFNTREYTFCFYDVHTREPLTEEMIEVSILKDNESPVNYLCTPDGCFTLKTDQSVIIMVVNTPYYRRDTIERILKKFNTEETIGLHANEYALMIRFFSEMNVEDWQKRRAYLDEMIDEGAMIYQVYGDNNKQGMELHTKWEFIDKLTMPAHSLKNIEILDTKYVGNRIMILRFRTSEKNK